MAGKIHVVPHFHWDREWYFTSEESKILLIQDMEEVMELLEQNGDYPCFVLDGQTAVLEDYFSVKPENRDRVERLVRQGKLIIGPWYTQTDEMVVGGESIVRNLLYGKLDCEKLGDSMKIGYLPDSFGQSARMPQILNGFGIRRCMFWRGVSERMGTDKTEFYWADEEGSRVLVQLLPLGYAIGKYLPEDGEALKIRMDKYLPVLDEGAVTDHILLPNGHDQMPVQRNIFQVMKALEEIYPGRQVTLGRYEEVFDAVEREAGERLPVLRGEFLDGKYMRVHRTIYSSRSDLKSANTRIENKITNILEPLMSIAWSLGFPYEHGLLESVWKELLKNHAHDSIGCCCSDKVHRAIKDRFFLAEERTDQLIRYYQRRIVEGIRWGGGEDKLTVFHLLPYERTAVVTAEIITKETVFLLTDEEGRRTPFEVLGREIVDPGLIDRQIVHYGNYEPFIRYTVAFPAKLPAMGYRTYLIQAGETALPEPEKRDDQSRVLENDFYRIAIEDNGTLEVLDKENGKIYQSVLLLEDGSDDGDGYDYSPAEEEWILDSHNARAEIEVETSRYVSTAKIRVPMELPRCLESRRKRILDGRLEMKFTVTLEEESPIIRVAVQVDNQAWDHRVRVFIPNGGPARDSVSDNPFGVIRRPLRDPAMDVWEAEEWSERPDSVYPFLSYVHGGTEEGMAVLTNSVREYEITGEGWDTIAVTLFRSVGVLGKEGLLRRPGRPSGIKMETPDSQMPGVNRYEFALTTHVREAALLAREYLTPPTVYNQIPYQAMKLNHSGISTPGHFSLLQWSNKEVIVSAVKKAEKEERLLLRCFNPTKEEARVRTLDGYRLWEERNLDESLKGPLDRGGIKIKPNQVKTFSLRQSIIKPRGILK